MTTQTKTISKDTPKQSTFVTLKEKQEINWYHTTLLIITPLLAIIGLFTVKIRIPTILLSIFFYFFTGLGITGGYHRLFSHRAFEASWIVRLGLILGGAAAIQGSAKWWCRNHRAHHRYTDTDKDPYNAKKGFWYAHMGWMLVKQNAKNIGYANVSDLQNDSMIQWQHRYYLPIAVGVGIVLPTAIAALWGDALGGFFYASMLRIVVVHHATFFVNSLAHYLGDKTFSDHHTAFDSFITAILTLGEGYHNYHHEFPQDYRNGIKFFQYDPTKWLIKFLSFFHLTYNIKQMTRQEIEKARLQMKQRKLDEEFATIQFGKKFDELPIVTQSEFNDRVQNNETLIIIDGVVHDVGKFVHEHPGGRQTLLNHVGTDASLLFEGIADGGGHKHSKDARRYLYAMRVGKLAK